MTPARDHVFAVVPFPEDPDAKKKGEPSTEWAIEHAKQVTIMN